MNDYLTDGEKLVEVVYLTPEQMKVRNVVTEFLFDIANADASDWRRVKRS